MQMNRVELTKTPLVHIVSTKSVCESMIDLRNAKRDGIYLPTTSTSAMFPACTSELSKFQRPKTKRQRRIPKCSAPPLQLLQTIAKLAQSEFAVAKIQKKSDYNTLVSEKCTKNDGSVQKKPL